MWSGCSSLFFVLNPHDIRSPMTLSLLQDDLKLERQFSLDLSDEDAEAYIGYIDSHGTFTCSGNDAFFCVYVPQINVPSTFHFSNIQVPSTFHRRPIDAHRRPSTLHRRPSTLHRRPFWLKTTGVDTKPPPRLSKAQWGSKSSRSGAHRLLQAIVDQTRAESVSRHGGPSPALHGAALDLLRGGALGVAGSRTALRCS